MNLVADASGLVGELLRIRGRQFLRHPDIDWFTTTEVAGEVEYELRRRLNILVARGRLEHGEVAALEYVALELFTDTVSLADSDVYMPARALAEARISDPNDWSVVALAMVMEAGIWTEDRDFFGIGLPVWNTRVLVAHLQIG